MAGIMYWEKILVLLVCLLLAGLVAVSRASNVSEAPLEEEEGEEGLSGEKPAPLVMVGILARNAAHTLPNFLGYFENLDYPKHRMAVW